MDRMRIVSARAAWLAISAAVAVGCIYDDDERCGPHMVASAIDSCVCEADYVLVGTECITCPENERVQGAGCACNDGYERSVEGAACTPLPTTGPGASCSAVEPCTDPDFTFCATASNEDQYCTSQGCETSADCPESFACAQSDAGSFCKRRPAGMETPCAADAECAGYEATFCETLYSKVCLVQGCSLSENDCFDGWECCDVTSFGMPIPICIPEGNCP